MTDSDQPREPEGEAALDAEAFHRWIDAAGEHLGSARLLVEGGRHPDAVLMAEQSAQCSLKSLLHAVGAEASTRGHDLVALARACAREVGLSLPESQFDGLRRLSATHLSSRYPDALPGGVLSDYFGAESSAAALNAAEATLDAAQGLWAHLLEGPDGEPEVGDL